MMSMVTFFSVQRVYIQHILTRGALLHRLILDYVHLMKETLLHKLTDEMCGFFSPFADYLKMGAPDFKISLPLNVFLSV